MSRVQWSNVEEGDEILVLKDQIGGQFFSYDLTEDAVLHSVSRFDWFELSATQLAASDIRSVVHSWKVDRLADDRIGVLPG